MATVGNTIVPFQTFGFYGLNSSNILAIKASMPANGTITNVNCYMAGHGATIHPIFCIWSSAGVLLAQTAQLTVGAGTGGLSGQSFQAGSGPALLTPLYVNAGTDIYIGFWRPASESDEWTEQNGGTEYQFYDGNNGGPGSPGAGWVSVGGTPSFYATYTALAIPTVTAFTPAYGIPGTLVTLTGTNFTGVTAVKLNGVSAAFTVINTTTITATVPALPGKGKWSVTNGAGTGTSASDFVPSLYGVARAGVINHGIKWINRSGVLIYPKCWIKRSGVLTRIQ